MHRFITARSTPPVRLLGGAAVAAVLTTLVAAALLVGSLASAAGASSSSTVAQAKKALLKLSDMPAGWSSSKASGDYSPIPGAAKLATCLGVSTAVVKGIPPTAYSANFTSQDGSENVNDNVTYYASAKAARADYGTYASPKSTTCLAAAFNGPAKAQLATGFGKGKLGTVLVTRDPASYFGSGVTNVALFFPVTGTSSTLNVELIITDYVTGNREQTNEFLSLQAPFPNAVAKQLSSLDDRRL